LVAFHAIGAEPLLRTVKPTECSNVYSITDLLGLVTNEGARELRLHVGVPPVIVVGGEDHTVEGPSISSENGEQLLRSVADTRLIMRIRRLGRADFIYAFRGCHRFVVHATVQGENVALDFQANRV
jgi:Tfp pilus assembly pilus retraction ATPase PilT